MMWNELPPLTVDKMRQHETACRQTKPQIKDSSDEMNRALGLRR